MKKILYLGIYLVLSSFILLACNKKSNNINGEFLCYMLVGVKEYKAGTFKLWLDIYIDGTLYIETKNDPVYARNAYDNFITKDLGETWEGYSGDIPYPSYSGDSSVTLAEGEELLSVEYNSNGIGWMVTKFEDDTNSVVYIKKTTDFGSTWVEQKKLNDSVRAYIKILSDNSVVIFLSPEIVLSSDDGGSNWTQNDLERGSNHARMDLFDSGIGYITVNDKTNSVLYKTTDYGQNWTIILDLEGTNYDYYKNILVIGEKRVFYTKGADIYRSQDGANTWEKLDNSFANFTYSTPMFPQLPCQF